MSGFVSYTYIEVYQNFEWRKVALITNVNTENNELFRLVPSLAGGVEV